MAEDWKTCLEGKCILITGVCGTVGSRLLRHLIRVKTVEGITIRGLDTSENGIFDLEQEYEEFTQVRLVVGDVRDRLGLERFMDGVDVVFHCATLKHVYQCEKAPLEALKTNILGVESVISGALRYGVGRVIFTSSDKAVNPTSVMGTSKLMGERLITAANTAGNGRTVFASIRLGNVLGASGSVMNTFRKQIECGGPVTLTSSEMSRFIMGIEEAISLVIGSAALARGGEVFITKMEVARISDLAEVMIKELAPRFHRDPKDIEVVVTGPRPGEKMYEELMTEEETRRALELPDYFVVLPTFRPLYDRIVYEYPQVSSQPVTKAYVSREERGLSQEALRELLIRTGLLA